MHASIKVSVHDFYDKRFPVRHDGERCRSVLFRYMDASVTKFVVAALGEYAMFYAHLVFVIIGCLYQNLLILGEVCDCIVAIDNLLYCWR